MSSPVTSNSTTIVEDRKINDKFQVFYEDLYTYIWRKYQEKIALSICGCRSRFGFPSRVKSVTWFFSHEIPKDSLKFGSEAVFQARASETRFTVGPDCPKHVQQSLLGSQCP